MDAPERGGATQSIKKVAAASFIGTTIEWYDFFLYGTAAALVFGDLFFPEAEPLVGTLLAFSTYAVGFAARPIGGIVFGHYGDRIGRKSMLVLSLLIMGVATFLIGVLPTYASIGIVAPILLVVLRFAQGIGVGGEWGGAVLMSVEHAPKGRRGFFGSWPQMGVPAGLLLSTGVFALVQAMTSEAAFMSWGWRVPFLASAILVGVGLFIRLKIMESPAFERVKETKTEAPKPIVDVVRKYPREVLVGDGHARRRERLLLHPHGVRARLRRGRAGPRQGDDADGRDHRRRHRPVHRAAVGRAVGPRRPQAALPGRRGGHDAVGVPAVRAA